MAADPRLKPDWPETAGHQVQRILDASMKGDGVLARARPTASSGLGAGLLGGLGDAALQADGVGRKLGIGRAQQEGVEAAIMLDGADGVDGQLQAHEMAERIREHGRILQIRQETASRLVVGVADVVTRQYALAGDGAASSHDQYPLDVKPKQAARKAPPEQAGVLRCQPRAVK